MNALLPRLDKEPRYLSSDCTPENAYWISIEETLTRHLAILNSDERANLVDFVESECKRLG